jgi:hypothetical protein
MAKKPKDSAFKYDYEKMIVEEPKESKLDDVITEEMPVAVKVNTKIVTSEEPELKELKMVEKPKLEPTIVKQITPIPTPPVQKIELPPVPQAPAAPPPKKFETKTCSFNNFRTFDENYAKIAQWIRSGWKIDKEKKTTSDHIIWLKKEI